MSVVEQLDTSLLDYALTTDDYMDQFIPLIRAELEKNQSLDMLIEALEDQANEKAKDLGKTSLDSVKDLVGSIDVIKNVVDKADDLGSKITTINKQMAVTGQKVIDQRRKMNELSQLESKIMDTQDTVASCLEVLGKTDKVLNLVQDFEFYRALSQLKLLNNEQLKNLEEFEFVNKIYESIPLFWKMISEESLEQLNSWLNVTVAKSIIDIGESIYKTMEEINENWEMKQLSDSNLLYYKVNSTVEKTFRDGAYLNFDPLEKLQIDLTPLYHAYLVFKEMNDLETLSENLSNGLLKLRDTILGPFRDSSIINTESLEINMYSISAFCILDQLISSKTEYSIRTSQTIEISNKSVLSKLTPVLTQYIKSMSQQAGNLVSFEQINETLGTFHQILTNWGFDSSLIYSVLIDGFNCYLVSLFENFIFEYNKLINDELWQGYIIENEDHYKIIRSQVFHMFSVENPRFPLTAPFSKIYVDTCKLLRTYILKLFKFVGRYFEDSVNLVTKSINDFIDKCLREVILKDLTYQINSAYESVKSQNLINLDFFCSSIYEIENWVNLSSNETLMRVRSPTKTIKLKVKMEFEATKHSAEVNLLKNLNEMMQNLIDPNDNEWVSLYWSSEVPENTASDNIETALGFLYDTFLFKFSSLPGHTKASLLLEAIDKVSQLLIEGIFKARMISIVAINNFKIDVKFIESTIDRFYQEGQIIEDADIHIEVLKNSLIELHQIIKILTELNINVIMDGGTRMKLQETDARSLLRKYEGYIKHKEKERMNNIENGRVMSPSPGPSSDYEKDDDNKSIFKAASSVFNF